MSSFSKRVEVWERWKTIDGVVYMEWKTPQETKWHRRRTALNQEPVVIRTFFTPKEWELKQPQLLTEEIKGYDPTNTG